MRKISGNPEFLIGGAVGDKKNLSFGLIDHTTDDFFQVSTGGATVVTNDFYFRIFFFENLPGF